MIFLNRDHGEGAALRGGGPSGDGHNGGQIGYSAQMGVKHERIASRRESRPPRSVTVMRRLGQVLIGASAVVLWLLVFGFVMFATAVMREAEPEDLRADGIVVLTGGDARIIEGAHLLQQRRGKRLLISGVNRRTSREDIIRLSGLSEAQFACCIDLGYEARDTIGNADETRLWASRHRFDSLIVVTASYHMPRSMAEISLALPNVALIPHPVMPKSFRLEAWWLHFNTTRVLIAEYLKYLPAAARLSIARLMGPWDASSIAEDRGSHRAKI